MQLGLVKSVNRPGGNITGVSLFTSTLAAKRLELLHQVVPAARVIALLVNPANPNSEPDTRAVQAAAPAMGLQIVVLKAHNGTEIEAAFAAMRQSNIGALLVGADPLFDNTGRDQLIVLAARHAIPAIYDFRDVTAAGGLLSYGSNLAEGYRALCQKQTLSHSIDHLVGAQLHLIGDGQSECSGSFQINNEFKFRRLLNRQIARLLTFENSYRVKASQTISFRKI